MARYAVLRVLQAIPIIFAVSVAAFALIHLVPGDPARVQLGAAASPQAVAELQRQYGLDEPLVDQYLDFLAGAVRLDFGESLTQNVPVSAAIRDRIVPTLLLLGFGALIAVGLAVPLALIAAMRRDRPADHAIRIGVMVLFAVPPFWLGLVLALIFGLQLGLLPTSGYQSEFPDVIRSLVLPSVTLGLMLAPILVGTLRGSLIDTMGAGFIEAARARGLSERRVVVHHVLRNSLTSFVTVLGVAIGFFISGAVVVEVVFGIPGLGSLLVDAVGARDFPLIQGLTVVLAAAVVLVNLLTDIAYAMIDPRVRL